MVSEAIVSAYSAILNEELVPALGCTEPIAVAYAAARAREILGRMPEGLRLRCSGNIVKNVKGVRVPNTGGLKGIAAAAVAGAVGGDAPRRLEVLQGVRPDHLEEIRRLLAAGYCRVSLAEGVENLYIEAEAFSGDDVAVVRIEGSHTNITHASRNGKPVGLPGAPSTDAPGTPESRGDAAAGSRVEGGALAEGAGLLNIRDILEYARTADLSAVERILGDQIEMNRAISDEGLAHPWGAQVGKTLLETRGTDVRVRAAARPAAGSDARMSGCSLPVVINSGSGNQGMTVSLPVAEYAQELGVPRDRLIRALALSNLVAIRQKVLIGKLSAYCGAVSAACGSGAGIAFLRGGGYREIRDTIANTLGNVGGIVCDGAKPSCAAKIATAVEAAVLAQDMAFDGKAFADGEGLVSEDVERTIENVGILGREGMKETDRVILRIMTSD